MVEDVVPERRLKCLRPCAGAVAAAAGSADDDENAPKEIDAILDYRRVVLRGANGSDIVTQNFYDVGVAVSTEKGLMVPIIRDCDRLGFADIEKAIAEVAKKALEDLKATFPDIGAAEKDYEKAMEKIVAAYNERGRKQAELETRIKGLESELAAAQAATTTVTTEKDSTIATLRQQIADEQKNAEEKKTELEGSVERLRGQLTERDGEAHFAERADLRGQRFVVAPEFKRSRRLDEGTVKALTGGDRVRAKHL